MLTNTTLADITSDVKLEDSKAKIKGNFDKLLENDVAIESRVSVVEENKLNINGDFQGTWNGHEFIESEPGLASTVEQHTSQLAEKANQTDLNNTNANIANLQNNKMDKNTADISVSQINKNLGKFDQTYMAAEFLQQIAGNTPINAVPATESITLQQLAFLGLEGQKSKNLFNKNIVTVDRYINPNTGGFGTSTDFVASDYIAVLPNTTYSKATVEHVAFYDVNKVFISGLNSAYTFTTPANTYFIRISVRKVNIDAEQVEVGNESTTYESFDTKIKPVSVPSGSIDYSNLKFDVVKPQSKKNLFNKNTVTNDKYVNYINGTLGNATGFCASDYIRVTPNTQYTKNNDNQFAYYDINKVFLSGVTDGTSTFTTPSGCYYVRLTTKKIELTTFQFELGASKTAYQSFLPSILKEQIIGVNHKNVVVVAKENGDYATISDAVNNVNSSATNPITILVMPGVYIESVNIRQKYISIVGVNKHTCILTNLTGDYNTTPLNISSNTYVANMTIYADWDEVTPYTLPAYGVHCDNPSVGVAEFNNCIIKSKVNAAVGIGLQDKQTLLFNNCELYSADRYAIYAHNYQLSGASQQKLTFKNCRAESESGVVIRIDDSNHISGGTYDDLKDTVFSFYNNIFWSKTLGKTGIVQATAPLDGQSKWGYIKLNGDSFGNNISDFNAS